MTTYDKLKMAPWPVTEAEAKRRLFLSQQREREERLAEDWRLTQALTTKAPGTVNREKLRQLISLKLMELRELLDIQDALHITSTREEVIELVDVLDRVAKTDSLWDDELPPPETETVLDEIRTKMREQPTLPALPETGNESEVLVDTEGPEGVVRRPRRRTKR